MSEQFVDLLVQLAAKGDWGVLERLPRYLTGYYVEVGGLPGTRDQLIIAFRDRAPRTELTDRMLEIIISST